VLTDRRRDSADIEVVRLADVLSNPVQLVDDGVASFHRGLPTGSSSGVQMIGGVRPSERHVASIVPRIAAFAMCLQFRVKRYSIWWSGGNADVKCIDGCFLRERPAPHKFLGKSGGLVGHCRPSHHRLVSCW
jgi:hypothetical protein